jgi:ribosomal protein L22
MDKKEIIKNTEDKIQKEIVKTPEEKIEVQKEANKNSEEGKDLTKKLEVKKDVKPKKIHTQAIVNVNGAPISTRHSVALCKFIKNKEIEKAIIELEDIAAKRRALPMKGEFAHRKGKGMMSGKYPQNSTRYFIKLLKSLQANSNANEIKEPRITEAIANLAPRPRGRFGTYQRKRTHITLVVKTKKQKKDNQQKKSKLNGEKK